MSDTRFPYGFALGKINNFIARTDNVFTESDTTPDVSLGSLFYTNNSSATVISYFDLPVPGGGAASNAAAFEGKMFWLVHLDSQTSFTRSAVLECGNGTFNPPSQSVTHWMFHNSAWYEISRGAGGQGNQTATQLVGAATSTINVKDRTVILLNNSDAGVSVIHQFLGGEPGQIVTLVPNSAGVGLLQIANSSGNIRVPGAATLSLALTGGYQFVSVDGTVFSYLS